MKKKAPKADPLAKLSAPNLRRMVKRRDDSYAALEKAYFASRRDLHDALADRDRLAAELASAKSDRDRILSELATLKRATAQVTQASKPPPDPAPATDVVSITYAPSGYWFRSVKVDGDQGERGWEVWTATPDTPTTLPAMPGMTLGVDAARPPSWWLPTWLRRNPTVLAPAVADSLEGRAGLLGDAVAIDELQWGSVLTTVRPSAHFVPPARAYLLLRGWRALYFPIPPATWRPA